MKNQCKLCLILVGLGCHNKIPPTRWLKQQKFILSNFWKLEVQALDSPEVSLLGFLMATPYLCPQIIFSLFITHL